MLFTIICITNFSWWIFPFTLFLGFDENIESQGELILQESFQVWDPKTLIRKGRERHLFLFEMSLVFSKEVKDSSGRSKYIYKSKLFVSMAEQLIIFTELSRIGFTKLRWLKCAWKTWTVTEHWKNSLGMYRLNHATLVLCPSSESTG